MGDFLGRPPCRSSRSVGPSSSEGGTPPAGPHRGLRTPCPPAPPKSWTPSSQSGNKKEEGRRGRARVKSGDVPSWYAHVVPRSKSPEQITSRARKKLQYPKHAP